MVIGGALGPHEWATRNTEEAAWSARKNIESGVAFLKVYQEATPAMIRTVAEEAHKAGLNVSGHIRASDAREAILAGINALAHGSGIAAATSPPDVAKRIKNRELRELGYSDVDANYLQDPAMFDDLIKLMVQRNVRMEPNFVAMFKGVYPQYEKFSQEDLSLATQPGLRIPESFVHSWGSHMSFEIPHGGTDGLAELMAKLKKGYANHQLFAKKFAAAGGKLFVGTDAWYVVTPGLALWHEMELMADAGIPPLAILQGSTINPAEFVHQDKNLGTVETGKLADLIVLGRNPLQDVRNVRSLETVIQHGKIQRLGYYSDYRNPVPRPYQMVPGQLPRPYISSVKPSAVPAGSERVVLTINGRDFRAGNRVLFDGADIEVLSVKPNEVQAAAPAELLKKIGTYKVTMITAGREPEPSWNFGEVIVSLGRKYSERWNGQSRNTDF
jgi:imidazolonepropionase-like amidohydrolase